MAAAYGVTPPQTTHLASSPMTMRSSGSSFRRLSSVGGSRAGSGSALVPRPPSHGPSFDSSARDSHAFEDGFGRAVSLSASYRRSVSSSPTVSGGTTLAGGAAARVATVVAPPTQCTIGFDCGQQQQQQGFASSFGSPREQQQQQPQANIVPFSLKGGRPPVRKAPGLLSKALTTEGSGSLPVDALPSSLLGERTSSSGLAAAFAGSPSSSFFPGVDMAPLRRAQERHAVFSTELVKTAYGLAAKAHASARRKDGSPLLSHCLEVALELADLGLDEETVAAGLLHEVLSGPASPASGPSRGALLSQLEEFMPRSVCQLVERVSSISDISRLYRHHRETFGDEKFRRMLVAMEDVRAVLVRLCDRVHNMRTAHALPAEARARLAEETLEIYAVVANRLGVWHLKAELEDLAFAALHPREYAELSEAVARRHDQQRLEGTIEAVKAGLEAHGVVVEDVSGRRKNLYGIWKKLHKATKKAEAAAAASAAGVEADASGGSLDSCDMGGSGAAGRTRAEAASSPALSGGGGSLQRSLDEVYDVTALRVIVGSKHDCYMALRAVRSVYRTLPGRSKDYIREIKKPNGYQSLHETVIGEGGVPMEVQIRTHKMHYIAEYGFAAHWKYKEKLDSEDEWLDKETQYKRWLTLHKLKVHDKKVRSHGSPPTADPSLKSLGVAYIEDAAVSETAADKVDPFLLHDRFKLQQPSRSAVQFLLQTQDSVETRECPHGTTAQDLAEQLSLGGLPGYALTVNGRIPAQPASLRLQSADLVQVMPLDQALSRSPPEQRRQLAVQYLAGASGAGSSTAAAGGGFTVGNGGGRAADGSGMGIGVFAASASPVSGLSILGGPTGRQLDIMWQQQQQAVA